VLTSSVRSGAESAGKPKSNGETVAQPRKGDPLGANSEIGRKLKQYYDDLVSDQVPDRFAQLLSQLENTEQPRGKG
jgi:hypothetical protein